MKYKNTTFEYGVRFLVLSLFIISTFIALSVQSADAQESQKTKISYPTLQPAGFLQQHFTLDNNEDNPANFSIHRARLGVKGAFSEKIKYNFIIGAVEPPNRSPALVNGFVDIEFHPSFNLRTGQFPVPFGVEGPEPIFLNPAIERAFPTRKMNNYRMFRDIGVSVFGRYAIVDYSLSVLNGNGANVTENIDAKDVVLRLNFNLSDHFLAGLSSQIGKYETDSLDIFSRQRFGAHFEYKDENSKNRFRGEFIYLDKQTERNTNEISMGGYLLYGYQFSGKFESIGRLEFYQPNKRDNTYYGLTLGGNYFPTDKTSLSLNLIGYSETENFNDLEYILNLQLQYIL